VLVGWWWAAVRGGVASFSAVFGCWWAVSASAASFGLLAPIGLLLELHAFKKLAASHGVELWRVGLRAAASVSISALTTWAAVFLTFCSLLFAFRLAAVFRAFVSALANRGGLRRLRREVLQRGLPPPLQNHGRGGV